MAGFGGAVGVVEIMMVLRGGLTYGQFRVNGLICRSHVKDECAEQV